MSRAGAMTVLFVDDEVLIGKLAATMLKRAGYTVLLAGHGAEALEIYRREGKNITLVVLDLSMPGLSIQEIIDVLVRLNPKVRVLIATGSREIPAWLPEHPCYAGFLPKPYQRPELLRAVAAALSEPSIDPQMDGTQPTA